MRIFVFFKKLEQYFRGVNWENIIVLGYQRYSFCIKFDKYLIYIFVILSKGKRIF